MTDLEFNDLIKKYIHVNRGGRITLNVMPSSVRDSIYKYIGYKKPNEERFIGYFLIEKSTGKKVSRIERRNRNSYFYRTSDNAHMYFTIRDTKCISNIDDFEVVMHRCKKHITRKFVKDFKRELVKVVKSTDFVGYFGETPITLAHKSIIISSSNYEEYMKKWQNKKLTNDKMLDIADYDFLKKEFEK